MRNSIFTLSCLVLLLISSNLYAENKPLHPDRESTDIYYHSVDKCYYIYYDFNSTKLSERSLQVIQQVADRLQEDSTLCVEICSFCDNIGNYEVNLQVGQSRADRVVVEFTKIYKIKEERLLPV